MPAKDIHHDAVKNALIKDGWTITHDPLTIQFGGVDFYVDLGAERMMAAEKNGQQIAVETKSFTTHSLLYEFHLAIGQFIHYRLALKEKAPKRTLYLAVPLAVYKEFFALPFVQLSLKTNRVKYFVYDIQPEVIVKWKN